MNEPAEIDRLNLLLIERERDIATLRKQLAKLEQRLGGPVLTLTDIEKIASACLATGSFNVLIARVLDHLGGLAGAPAAPTADRPTDDEQWDKTLQDRDHYHDMADQLANQIAAMTAQEIGEHSSANDPWRNALIAADEFISERSRNSSSNLPERLAAAPDVAQPAAPGEARDAGGLTAYDPNIRWAKQRVLLQLRQWQYVGAVEVTIGGNCKGFDIFDSAIGQAYERLLGDGNTARVTLTASNGDTLECEDEEQRDEDWLKPMVVGMEIIEQAPESTNRPIANGAAGQEGGPA